METISVPTAWPLPSPERMHWALKVDEIIRLICLCIDKAQGLIDDDTNEEEDEARANLLHMATTCKAWKGPALDCLWSRYLYMREVLCPLVASGVLVEAGHTGLGDAIKLGREPTPDDKVNYAPYASRVLDVHVGGAITADALTCIQAWRSAGPIYTRIRDITVGRVGPGNLHQAVSIFLAPSVQRITMVTYRAISQSLIDNCLQVSSNLESLSLHVSSDAVEQANQLASILSKFLRLRELKIDSMGDNFILYLLNSPLVLLSLTNLALGVQHGDMQELKVQIPPNAFPALQILSMNFPDTGSNLNILGAISASASLRTVRVEVEYISERHFVQNVLDCLTPTVASGKVLESLAINAQRTIETGQSVTFLSLQPLSNSYFLGLKHLEIRGPLNFDIQDSHLTSIGDWCPHLTSLHLGSPNMYNFHPTPIITLVGLIKLLRQLTTIRDLTLPVKVCPMEIEVGTSESVPSIQHWNLSYSTAERPIEVAVILLRHLPKLESVHSAVFPQCSPGEIHWGKLDEWGIMMAESMLAFTTIQEFLTLAAKNRKRNDTTLDGARGLFI